MHKVSFHVNLIQARDRKMVVEPIIYIARILFLAIDDFRLVLLEGGTTQLPEFITRQLFLSFLGKAYTAWTQKERARSCSLTVSFSFCVNKKCY
jgi:hypothetical protein